MLLLADYNSNCDSKGVNQTKRAAIGGPLFLSVFMWRVNQPKHGSIHFSRMDKFMIKARKTALIIAFFFIPVIAIAEGEKTGSFSPYVDSRGNIILPTDFRSTWVHLGSWAVPAQRVPYSGFHDVYSQPGSYKAYKETGKWPDGALIVKEIRQVVWDEMATGHVVYAGEPSTWFVMVKDTRGRFKGNPNWGDGWGWALFKAAYPAKNMSTDYKNDCLDCHEPARTTDWVYIKGYPALR